MYFCSKKVMLNTFKNYLLINNITIQNEDETTISFKKDDLYYLFVIYKDDPFYFRIMLPNLLQVTDNKDKIIQLVNDINLKFKVAKVFIVDDKNVWISVEQFAYTMDKIDDLFNRIFILYASILEEIKVKIKDL
ncbi:conserved domain protein [Paraprevotella xylaniphila YIT 11841]|uniref:Conserved domain protein n=2 Tax=Paraprevotella xylaniphila TaxID=454155 RepID=F3QV43_9BACT|nr:conserved domain protein [Paraprevotella xylaniphila YIT 11841]